MEYRNEQIEITIDTLIFSNEDSEKLNKIFANSIMRHHPSFERDEIGPISRIIITDGLHQTDFKIVIDE